MFSERLRKALDAIIPDTTPSYESAVIEDARANPSIHEGMTCGVYEPYDGELDYDRFIGYGRILSVRWNNFELQYEADVLMYDGSTRTALSCELERWINPCSARKQ